MPTGKVTLFNQDEGFGFIAPDDGAKPVFVRIAAVEQAGFTELKVGQAIEYTIITPPVGRPFATNLRACAPATDP